MTTLKIAVRLICVLAFVTGAVDIVDGVGLLSFAGVRLQSVARDPTLNSQIAFWGAIWFGYGVVLWRASLHLRSEPSLFRLLCGILVLSGLARVGAAFAYGLPAPPLVAAMAIELVGGTALLLWHGAALRTGSETLATAQKPL